MSAHKCLVAICTNLQSLGFTDNLYHRNGCVYHNGRQLARFQKFLLDFWYDDSDMPITVYLITSGYLKGFVVLQGSELLFE